MKDQLDLLLSQHRDKFVILDTNILLVYLVGCVDPKLIESFKKTNSRYCSDDFQILDNLLGKLSKFSTTPNILTEVSNLGGQLSGSSKERFFELLAQFIQITAEEYVPSSTISQDTFFIKFGITDRGIFELAKANYLVITDDFKLSAKCKNSINFNHLRDYANYN
jgi:hypothetical protein